MDSAEQIATPSAVEFVSRLVRQLQSTERGQEALDTLDDVFESGVFDGLCVRNKKAVDDLLKTYWHFPEVTRRIVHDVNDTKKGLGNDNAH